MKLEIVKSVERECEKEVEEINIDRDLGDIIMKGMVVKKKINKKGREGIIEVNRGG